MQQRVKLQFKKNHLFETKCENILAYDSEAQMDTFDEKNGGRKSHATVPLIYIISLCEIVYFNSNNGICTMKREGGT
jgi:hypothetical protein